METSSAALAAGIDAAAGDSWAMLGVAITVNAAGEAMFNGSESVKNFWTDVDEYYCGKDKGIAKSICKLGIFLLLHAGEIGARTVCLGPKLDCEGKCGEEYYGKPEGLNKCNAICGMYFLKCMGKGP
jgi:hypothetical protein